MVYKFGIDEQNFDSFFSIIIDTKLNNSICKKKQSKKRQMARFQVEY